MPCLLEVKGITKAFPGSLALQNVDLDLNQGEIHGLVGANGAGKSTLVKIITGALSPDRGQILIDGKEVSFNDPREAYSSGISIVPQESNLIFYFDGIENIFLGNEAANFGIIDRKTMESQAKRLMEQLGVDVELSKPVRELNPAQRKLIEILRALNYNPRILILDEPTAAMTKNETEHLFSVMDKLRKSGSSIIFISHYLDEILRMCDRITILKDGKKVATCNKENVTEPEIVKMMINQDIKNQFPKVQVSPGKVILEARNVATADGTVIDASIDVKESEIIGIFGLVGAGRTEFVEALFGARRIIKGDIILNGKVMKNYNIYRAIGSGVTLIPEDRLSNALFLSNSVMENLSMVYLNTISRIGVINSRAEVKNSLKLIDNLNIVPSYPHNIVNNLSGGNKQKVSFGKWLFGNRKNKVFIFDEPTEGVDVGAKVEMYNIIGKLASEGAGIILVSSDIEEVIGLSDRIMVMHEGYSVGTINRENFSQEKILSMAMGTEVGVRK
ncbi:MAG TPA: sugar ABC transporter ATP-binding protein [Thermoanaerobacterales bacterium]|nr:sugar ABC transporter ATP-binding protein [Thermoanaerobacterales bacterium]